MRHRTELILLLLWNIPAFLLSLLTSNYLVSAFWFFGIPSLYLLLKAPKCAKKPFLFSTVFTLTGLPIIDYLAHQDGSWFNFSITGIRFLNSYPIEDFVWGILYFFYVLFIYEYFFEREKILKVPKKFIRFEVLGVVLAVVGTGLFYIFPTFSIPYFYAGSMVIFGIFIPGLILCAHPRLLNKMILLALYFIPLSFLYEWVANYKVQWTFPGKNFIGYVELVGVTFPFEEMVWLVIVPAATALYFEFFADDDR
jgi:hypothetical protein